MNCEGKNHETDKRQMHECRIRQQASVFAYNYKKLAGVGKEDEEDLTEMYNILII